MNCFRPVEVQIHDGIVYEVPHIVCATSPPPYDIKLEEPNRVKVVEHKKAISKLDEIIKIDKTEKKPKLIEDEKKFPKVRVSLDSFNELQSFRKKYKCKSYCEVVNKLLTIYDEAEKIDSQRKHL
ncbi:hypothetical protein EIN_097570 [Entamoeba invadens IP1]|uniref:Uncharacterized protein n=1 Tax=Entamoeba invadens IP1 TaxID=370355 RepID=A0A0A1U0P2_ENTIV|nr:hypothetical protein EIN_097570 [Entamoeba invadens IP1]ELP87470.1 hypothetical protein EIN_097570 [Entamoeba invadens IP1]|eukprot:XP_004254241.1 hypothetical protein EIN_097570 [Entamoeba invadens IP1]